MQDIFNNQNRVALIAGTLNESGMAAAVAASEAGYAVISAMHGDAMALAPHDEAFAKGGVLWLSPAEGAAGCVARALARYGKIDLLVFNVSGAGDADSREYFDHNYLDALRYSQAVIPSMLESGAGILLYLAPEMTGEARVLSGYLEGLAGCLVDPAHGVIGAVQILSAAAKTPLVPVFSEAFRSA